MPKMFVLIKKSLSQSEGGEQQPRNLIGRRSPGTEGGGTEMNKVIEMFMFTLAIEWVYDLSSSFDGFPHSDSDICPSYVCNNLIPFAFLSMYGTYRHHILYKTGYVCPPGPRQGLNRPEWELYPVPSSQNPALYHHGATRHL
jgi:hypothetical protein